MSIRVEGGELIIIFDIVTGRAPPSTRAAKSVAVLELGHGLAEIASVAPVSL